MKTIGRRSFCACSGLAGITLPAGLIEIGLSAFSGSGIENFVAPGSLQTIRQGAFAKCMHIKTVVLNEGLKTLGTDEYPDDGRLQCGVFEESSLESVELSSTLKRI